MLAKGGHLLQILVNSEMEERKTVHEALNGEQSSQWREAMESEYSSLLKNDTWDLVPPPEGKNIVGKRVQQPLLFET